MTAIEMRTSQQEGRIQVKRRMKKVSQSYPADKKPKERAVWNYSSKKIKRDINDVLVNKYATCNVGCGVPCGAQLKQAGSSKTGPRTHLKR